jgi:arylformamidase
MKIIDISLRLNKDTVIYPKNPPLIISTYQSMPENATQLSLVSIGSHTGTHIDAPAHAIQGARTIDDIPLETFFGPCRIFDFSLMTEAGGAVTKEMLLVKNIQKNERILLKTFNSIRGFKLFYNDYVYLDGDAADYLASLGVMLVAIDALSIKQRGSTDHRPHLSLLSKNIPIIEGINLADVSEGIYTFMCLPLAFTGIDGSPVRAVLMEI